MNSMSKHDGPGNTMRGHEYITGRDRRNFPGAQEGGSRLASAENVAGEAASAVTGAARRLGSLLWGSPVLTLALLVGAGYLLSRLAESRR